MWLTILSDQLPVKSLGGPLPRQQADRRRAHLQVMGLAVPTFNHSDMRRRDTIKDYHRFHDAIFVLRADYSPVTHPFAAIPLRESRDLHA